MYADIHVPVDNSEHSNASIELAVSLGRAFGSKIVGSHVYAAKLHDVRFKQMEFTLPDEYKEEEELEKQRKIHDALIARGLHLISDSYLDQMAEASEEAGLEFERKHFDGRNFEAIVDDVKSSDYGLVILGALGMGAVKSSQVGSVCERVLRRTTADTIVVRNPEVKGLEAAGPILVAMDGSSAAYGALRTALAIAKAGPGDVPRAVHVVAVREPGRPEDELLARHLDVARAAGESEGVEVTVTLATGTPREALLAAAEDINPFLIAVGRRGLETTEDGASDGLEIGSTAEAIVRQGQWNVLLSGRTWSPAEELSTESAA